MHISCHPLRCITVSDVACARSVTLTSWNVATSCFVSGQAASARHTPRADVTHGTIRLGPFLKGMSVSRTRLEGRGTATTVARGFSSLSPVIFRRLGFARPSRASLSLPSAMIVVRAVCCLLVRPCHSCPPGDGSRIAREEPRDANPSSSSPGRVVLPSRLLRLAIR